MAIFIDTTGRPSLAVALCDRCQKKFPIGELLPDRNSPGLLVCRDDNDLRDPYRYPFVPRDANIGLPRARPEIPIPTNADYTVNSVGAVVSAPVPVDTSVKPSST